MSEDLITCSNSPHSILDRIILSECLPVEKTEKSKRIKQLLVSFDKSLDQKIKRMNENQNRQIIYNYTLDLITLEIVIEIELDRH